MEVRCEVIGGTPPQRDAVRGAAQRAMRALDFYGIVTARISANGPAPGVKASAGPGRVIWLDSHAARRGGGVMEYLVTEEIAHVYLAEVVGIPHGDGFTELLAQELFATWVPYRDLVLTGRARVVGTHPIPRDSPRLGAHIGKHLATAALGSAANQRHLDDWMADESVDERLKATADRLTRTLPWEGPPAVLAAALRDFYDSTLRPERGA